MLKIALIGSGSITFTRNLCNDIFLTPALAGCQISLMDIDPGRLEASRQIVAALRDQREAHAKLEATTDRRQAVRGAKYVITTFQQGGLEAYRLDIEIPRHSGVGQCVGDTLGPGGIFRGLRSIPVLLDLCRDLDELAPEALLLNYVNPMPSNCWAVSALSGRPVVGLCHSVQETSRMLARWVEVPYEEVAYRCAGINHQAFFLEFRRGETDLYPAIFEAAKRPEIMGEEPIRIDLLNSFGYFVTESSGHASEFLPYYRKNEAMIEADLASRFTDPGKGWYDFGRTGGYLRNCEWWEAHWQQSADELLDGRKPAASQRTHEYAAYILEALEGGEPFVFNGNVPNQGWIANLPEGACVEVPILASQNGLQPQEMGSLPPQLAGLNRQSLSVHELVVEAVRTGRKATVVQALLLDPLTAAVCTLPQIEALAAAMLQAEARWLPRFG